MISVSLYFSVSEMVSNLGHFIDFTVCGTIQLFQTSQPRNVICSEMQANLE